jgi:hypothetical protein
MESLLVMKRKIVVQTVRRGVVDSRHFMLGDKKVKDR